MDKASSWRIQESRDGLDLWWRLADGTTAGFSRQYIVDTDDVAIATVSKYFYFPFSTNEQTAMIKLAFRHP